MVKQLSVFLPNEPGTIADFTALLVQNSINIRAITIADTSDFGILRIIVDDPEKCGQILKKTKYLFSEIEVIAFEVEDKPGGLHKIAKLMGDNGISIEYLYSMLKADKAVVLIRVDNYYHDNAIELLKSISVRILEDNEVYNI
ncbi:MAG TPA: ACT domain-containing protein [Candidatus Deferrimicrobium sp.]|nr:ACT domain-containing protein [Candidatus Deferrimicrobium sp.]